MFIHHVNCVTKEYLEDLDDEDRKELTDNEDEVTCPMCLHKLREASHTT